MSKDSQIKNNLMKNIQESKKQLNFSFGKTVIFFY